MDNGLSHEKVHQRKREQEKHPSLKPAVLVNQVEFVESDEESLAQERGHQQQQLQMRVTHDQSRHELTGQSTGLDDEDTCGGDAEYLHVFDSLDESSGLHDTRSPSQRSGMDKGGGNSSLLLSDDVYSDLRYNPNWRRNLKAAADFKESPRTSLVDFYKLPVQKPVQTHADGQEAVIKGGYRYITDSHPAMLVTPVAVEECDQPYRLHLQHPQTDSETSPHHYNHASQPRSEEGYFSSPNWTHSKSEENTAQTGSRETHDDKSQSLAAAEKNHDRYIHEGERGADSETQRTPHSNCMKASSQRNQKRLTEDIVERNKVTLGRNKPGYSSYVRMHALKQDGPRHVSKVKETRLEKVSETESHEESSDPEQRWIQKTQQLRVTQLRKGRKSQRQENPDPFQQRLAPAPGVRGKQGHSLSSVLAKPADVSQPKHLKTPTSLPLPPTIQLNINLNTSSHLHPIQQRGGDAVINLAPLQGCPLWIPVSEEELPLSPQYLQTDRAEILQTVQRGAHPQLYNPKLQGSPDAWQRAAVVKYPSSRESDEVQSERFIQDVFGNPTTTSSTASSVYTVLPPIGQPHRGSEPSSGQSVNQVDLVHRRNSDGYLLQMEKQKQRVKATYKAYSLKDYKQLKSDIVLQGLGPDHKAIEKTAEKLKRQRLYSNVIREQNKKISRIPFLLAKDPEDKDKKVPRMKALEYAKTIAKPAVQPQPKQRQKHQSEGLTEHAQYLEGLNMALLDVLRKRHDEEKQVVALLRKGHAP